MSGEAGNPHTRLEIGTTLRRVREKRGLSHHQVEEATKIRSRYLRDLENENFEVLPAVYVVGFLKTYADNLGLDGAELVAELKRRQAAPEAEQERAREESQAGRPSGLLASLGRFVGIGERVEDEAGTVPNRVNGPFVSLAVVLVSVFLAAALASGRAGEGRDVISQMREPNISQMPARGVLVGNVDDSEPASGYGKLVNQPEKQAEIPSRNTRKDEAEVDKSGQVSDAPGTVQVSSSPAIAFAGASANVAANASANASVPSTGSAPSYASSASAPATPAAKEEPESIRRSVTPAGPAARAERPTAERSVVRRRYPARQRDLEQRREGRGFRVVTLQRSSSGSFEREQRPHLPNSPIRIH